MAKHKEDVQQLGIGIDEMHATIERLGKEIERQKKEKNALEDGNLALYQKLIDF